MEADIYVKGDNTRPDRQLADVMHPWNLKMSHNTFYPSNHDEKYWSLQVFSHKGCQHHPQRRLDNWDISLAFQ